MEKPTSHAAKRDQSLCNSTAAQCNRLAAELRRCSVSTIYARDELEIMSPASRVFELRHYRRLNIHMHWKTETTASGKDRRIGEYVLLAGKWEGNEL